MTRWHAMALGAVLLFANPALAQPGEVTSLDNVDYVEHDGVKLAGDLYLPKDTDGHQDAADHRHPRRRMAGRQPGGLPALGALSRPQRLRHVRHQVSAREDRHLSEGGL